MSMAMVYMSSMFVVLVIAHYGVNNKVQSKELVAFSLALIFIILFVISGFRTGIGDTYFYKHSYTIVGENLAKGDMQAVKELFSDEVGFNAILVGLNYITPDPQILVVVMAFITNFFNLKTMHKYGRPFELSIFLYFATVIFYVTMNGMRQAFVASIFFWGVQFIIKGNWIKYFVLISFLTLFHSSAIVLYPVYFIARQKAWGKFFWRLVIILGVSVILFKPFMPIVVNMLEGGRYDAYAQDMASGGDGVNAIRILVMFVPLVMAYLVKDDMAENWKESHIFIYMSLFNLWFMLLGSQYLYFYRVCIYFELFNLVLIPYTLCFMEKKLSKLTYVYLITLYSLFCYYQVSIVFAEKFSNVLFK